MGVSIEGGSRGTHEKSICIFALALLYFTDVEVQVRLGGNLRKSKNPTNKSFVTAPRKPCIAPYIPEGSEEYVLLKTPAISHVHDENTVQTPSMSVHSLRL